MISKHRIHLISIPLLLLGLTLIWQNLPENRATPPAPVAKAKGGVIANRMMSVTDGDQILWNLALNDAELGELMQGKDVKLLSALPVGTSEASEYAACDHNCTHLRFYNFTDGGTVEAIFDQNSAEFIDQWQDTSARPNPSAYIVDDVVAIAAKDERVVATLGDIRKAEVAMIPMSTWLQDDACKDDWCVDLTFHDPAGSGKVFHVVTNMHEEKVARTFFTRGRPVRQFQESAELDPNAPRYTNGCHQANEWELCWEMTANDGVNFIDAAYKGQLIFTSAKISQVEAYYPSWPGGYRDEIGNASTVPPKFDTRVRELDGGFEVVQLFTEPFDWPNCICCYRYEQIMQFFDDGSFGTRFISQGPGCDELSEYRPFWRFNMAIDGEQADRAYFFQDNQWTLAETETDLALFEDLFVSGERFATTSGDGAVTFEWIPEATDPLGLDEGRIFFVESEGERDIPTGPADTYEPPRRYVNGDSLLDEDSDLTVWYIPVLKTKRGGPWWCQPDPEPEVNPCYSAMRVRRTGKLVQPSEEQLAQLRDAPTATPTAAPTATPAVGVTPDAIAVLPTQEPTRRPVTGTTAEEIILNSGCGACHAIGDLGEEGKVGPSLNNIGGLASDRVPGQSAETYLYNSIIYPNAYITPDCPNGECLANVMPGTYHLTLSEPQVNTLVDYMLNLREAEPEEIAGVDINVVTQSAITSQNGDATAAEPTANGSQLSAQQQPSLSTIMLITGVVLVVISVVLIVWILIPRKTFGSKNGGDSTES